MPYPSALEAAVIVLTPTSMILISCVAFMPWEAGTASSPEMLYRNSVFAAFELLGCTHDSAAQVPLLTAALCISPHIS